jgi:cytochrome c oxidase subunit 4
MTDSIKRERKILLFISVIVIISAFGAVGYLAAMGMLAKLDGIALALISLLIAVIFATASAPEVLSMFPLPPAVDELASTHHDAAHHDTATVPFYMLVWAGLLGLTLIEVGLAYMKMSVGPMLAILMCLSIMKAALIIAYFMHLRFERLSLVLTLMPALVLCISLLAFFFPDSVRMRNLGRERDMLKTTPVSATDEPAGESH